MMTARMFRLTQIHQKIDELLRLERRRSRPDRRNMARLMELKLRARKALGRLYLTRAPA